MPCAALFLNSMHCHVKGLTHDFSHPAGGRMADYYSFAPASLSANTVTSKGSCRKAAGITLSSRA